MTAYMDRRAKRPPCCVATIFGADSRAHECPLSGVPRGSSIWSPRGRSTRSAAACNTWSICRRVSCPERGPLPSPAARRHSTPSGRALLQMSGVFAEFERAILKERIYAGLARARAEGKHLGRRRTPGATDAAILTLREQGLGILKKWQEAEVRHGPRSGDAEGSVMRLTLNASPARASGGLTNVSPDARHVR